ncbi:uncharacterized protein LOC132296065 [Cornus florida]|uniref:uncharacterized protein LOC132296065 n=1 Tax=Cornus florida TaxID=4283 RepID=UPI0028967F43|nr:uncharacterized protein LOC132296065 [Cornus florida]
MYKQYTTWIYHGESVQNSNNDQVELGVNDIEDQSGNADEVHEYLEDIRIGEYMNIEQEDIQHNSSPLNIPEGEGEGGADRFARLLQDSQCEVYPGCQKFTKLSCILRLRHLKVMNRWTNKSLTMLLEFLKELLPKDETLPKSHYELKKILRDLGLGYETIHACKHDCVLFWKEYEHNEECPKCGAPRYKFHEGKRKKVPQKVLRYFPLKPRFQRLYMSRKTAKDMRWHKEKRVKETNVLKHPADSRAWEEFDNQHAYNVAPWKLMRDPYVFMPLLIPGPKSPGKDIDVYLRPLIDKLKELWVDGVSTFDACTGRKFKLHAACLWTLNDLPALADLSDWCTKGYMRNRSKQFDGYKEHRLPPKELSGDEILEKLEQLDHIRDVNFEKVPNIKKRKRTTIELNWTKTSIFFELPYWRLLKLQHNLDIMHIEKNICDNVLGTLMNIEGKTKDSLKARLDLQEMGIRKELHLISTGAKYVMPPACYTLSTKEKKEFCEWLKTIKFLDGYASNISRCVNVAECKIYGMKSHDSHVLLQRLLPIGIRGCLDHDICNALVELGIFFKELCCRTLKVEVLEALERDIALILCKLEMIFPPTFFDIMVHLAVHLPREALIAGPVQYRWMYPIEIFLCTLKSYVRNKARPECLIAEAYVDSECITFCSLYLSGVETRFNREERNYEGDQTVQGASLYVFRQVLRPLGSSSYDTLDLMDIDRAHLYIKQLRQLKDSSINDDTFSLACGPERRVKRYSGCIVNGSRFHTKDREQNRKTQNSGISVKCEGVEYYGVLTDVIELKYILGRKVFIFKCDWRDVTTKLGIHKDPHFTSVNVSRQSYEDQPFVLPQQVQQVFYVKDTKLRGSWEVVQKITCRRIFDVSVVEDGKREEEEDENNTENDAYQESEPCIVDGVVQDCPNIDQLSLNRDDIPSDQIDVEVVHKCRQDTHVVDNEDVELFDSTTDEEYTLPTDDDTDESDWEEG